MRNLLLSFLMAAGLSHAALLVTAPTSPVAVQDPGVPLGVSVTVPLSITNTGPITYSVVTLPLLSAPPDFGYFGSFGRIEVGQTRTDFVLSFFNIPRSTPAGLYTVTFQARGSNPAGTIVDFSDPVSVQLNIPTLQNAAVPEPSALILLGSGAMALLGLRRLRR